MGIFDELHPILSPMVSEKLTCPRCEMELRHEGGCPYEGLTMRAAWKRYKREQREISKEIRNIIT
jgi:hypothetical protein